MQAIAKITLVDKDQESLYIRKEMLDEKMLDQLSAQDPAALQRLVNGYFPVLCRFAEKFVSDSSLAKDIVQETFIKLWKYKPVFDSPLSLKAYLFTLTRNGCLNMIRSRKRLEDRHGIAAETAPAESPPVISTIIQTEYIALIYEIVSEMPENVREVFYLSYEEGLSLKEISERLKINIKSVRNARYRALVALRKKLDRTETPLLVLLTALLH